MKLRMRYGTTPRRESKAWFIAGEDPTLWLGEVASWGIAQATIRLLPVPRSRSDRRPMGALAIANDAPDSVVSPGVIAFGNIAGQLFLPVEAWLDPEVSDAELRALLSAGYTYVWHPSSGLIACEPDDALGIADLLTIDDASQLCWDAARAGVAVSSRLRSITAEAAPSVGAILDQGRDDIGSKQDAITELPPSPAEPKSDVGSSIARHAKRALAAAAQWLAQHAPKTSRQPTGNPLGHWAANQLSKISAQQNALRNKQILRLLHLLESDPDRGLRFAPSIGGPAHRGLAPPTHQLGERNVDFDLRGLRAGGGGPADFWHISFDFQSRLETLYRKLANREINLGRHRRAAFIFAELLGDYAAAANALENGRHWREAAALYRDQLHRPLNAARCLQQGGLWMEAIALYEELAEHESAGDVYRRLEQQEDALQQYRLAVQKHRASGDALSAARLLEEKIGSVDEALEELKAGWPDSAQAPQCLTEVVRILGRLGRHAAVADMISEFREPHGDLDPRRRVELVSILAGTATHYPDRQVCDQAADCTRALVSRELASASPTDGRLLLAAIRRLVPQDRLLDRDCRRFARQQLKPNPVGPARRVARTAGVIRRIQLPGHSVFWRAAIGCGSTIYAAGFQGNELVLARSDWNQAEPLYKTWQVGPASVAGPIILTANPRGGGFVFVHVVGGPTLRVEHLFPRSKRFVNEARAGGVIRGASAGLLGATTTEQGITWLFECRNEMLALVAVGANGELMSSRAIARPQPPIDLEAISLHASQRKIYVGLENQLRIFGEADLEETVEFGQRIIGLARSRHFPDGRLAVTHPRGGRLCGDGADQEPFAAEMLDPVVGFNRAGCLIAVCEDYGQIYNLQRSRLRRHAGFGHIGSRPIAVLSAPIADQFGIVTEAGEILVFSLS